MKYVLFLAVAFASCGSAGTEQYNRTDEPATNYVAPKNMQRLSQIRQQYIAAFEAAPNSIQQEELKRSYAGQIENFLTDTCKSELDSVLIHVESIDAVGAGIADIACSAGGVSTHYLASERSNDFKFIRTLKPDQDFIGKLLYLGETEINNPGSPQVIRIKAAPFPMDSVLSRAVVEFMLKHEAGMK